MSDSNWIDSVTVDCPTCGAPAGTSCRRRVPDRGVSHRARVRTAGNPTPPSLLTASQYAAIEKRERKRANRRKRRSRRLGRQAGDALDHRLPGSFGSGGRG